MENKCDKCGDDRCVCCSDCGERYDRCECIWCNMCGLLCDEDIYECEEEEAYYCACCFEKIEHEYNVANE
jgi:hypothetical protein